MAGTAEITTLICLFHHHDQAQEALKDLLKAGVPESSIQVIDGAESRTGQTGLSTLSTLGVPQRDEKHLYEGIEAGGVVVAVSAIQDHVDTVEDIFENHSATKIDEAVTEDDDDALYAAPLAAAGAAAVTGTQDVTGETAIPIVQEDLVVGKRAVDAGGVRVYRRIVEIPVEQSVNLREEHVTVDRIPVNRAVTDQDLALGGNRTIELTETAEEAVVGKSARVVEEVLVGKEAAERTETIHDTVRSTEVEVERIAPQDELNTTRRDL